MRHRDFLGVAGALVIDPTARLSHIMLKRLGFDAALAHFESYGYSNREFEQPRYRYAVLRVDAPLLTPIRAAAS